MDLDSFWKSRVRAGMGFGKSESGLSRVFANLEVGFGFLIVGYQVFPLVSGFLLNGSNSQHVM